MVKVKKSLKGFFFKTTLPKKQTKISALAFKMGPIKKRHFIIINNLNNRSQFFLFDPFQRLEQKSLEFPLLFEPLSFKKIYFRDFLTSGQPLKDYKGF